MVKKSKNTTSAALSYVLGPVTGVLFLLIEKEDYVRFHAMQSIVVFTVLAVLQWALGVTLIFLPLVPIIGIVMLVLWFILIYKAWQGDEWQVPILGKFVRRFLAKM